MYCSKHLKNRAGGWLVKKTFVLDTNVLLSDPNSLFKFDEHDIVIPISVIEEIDNFKKEQSEIGRNAREVSRILDSLRKNGSLASGVSLVNNHSSAQGSLSVHLTNNTNLLPSDLVDNNDNRILSVALALQKKLVDSREIVLITRDSNLRIKSDALSISSEDFQADKIDISHLYTGVKKIDLDKGAIEEFNNKKRIHLQDYKLCANQFVFIQTEQDKNPKAFGVFDEESKEIVKIDVSEKNLWGIAARNREQKLAVWAMLNENIKLVTLTGGAGTGKTLLAIAAGLTKTTDEDCYNRVLVARPIFPLGKDIGFLPGDVDEKLNPWMQPIYDGLDFLLGGGGAVRHDRYQKTYQELINQGILTVEPITYIRGRSLPHSFFIVDEAQNLTPHEIKTIITRAGEGTKIVLTGDPFQIDNPYVDSTNNGLTHVVERFKDSDIAAHITFQQGERSHLATLAAKYL